MGGNPNCILSVVNALIALLYSQSVFEGIHNLLQKVKRQTIASQARSEFISRIRSKFLLTHYLSRCCHDTYRPASFFGVKY